MIKRLTPMKIIAAICCCYLLNIPLVGVCQNSDQQDENKIPFLINEYYKDVGDLQRVYIFPLSEEYFSRFSSFYNSWLKKLDKINFEKLNTGERVDYVLLKRNILDDQYNLNKSNDEYSDISFCLPFSADIIDLQKKRRRGATLDGRTVAEILKRVIDSIEIAKSSLLKNPIRTKELRQMAVEAIRDLRAGLRNVHSFYNGYDPEYTWWMKTAFPEADSALEKYSKWISEQPVKMPDIKVDNSGIIGHPVGRDEILRQLRFQMIPYTPEELIKIAERQYEWCEQEMKKVSKQMGLGNNWKSALEVVKKNFLSPGKQPALINKLQEEAIAFIDSLDLVTIPSLAREVWRMDMLSVQQMKFASYFLGGPTILIAYPHEDQDFETKRMIMRSGNYGFAHAEVFHELIPGHNLQYFMFSRYKPYRSAFNSPFSMEGWPFYWEMLLWDKGFDKTNDEKIGALFWRMTRCVRIVFSLNYHLGNWTPQQCIDYMVDKAGLERFSAESEVRRSFTGGYGPLYQLAYMIGALQMYSLHKELVESGKMTNKEFNDSYLREGPIPIEMFRAIILNQKINKDFSTRWKF